MPAPDDGYVRTEQVTIDSGIGNYVRWRARMVRLSVLADIERVIGATGWASAELAYPFEVKEFFPEFAVYANDTVHVNTLVLDHAEPSGLAEYELGGLLYQNYRINMALYAQDDETGIAVFSDLADRFSGRTDAPYISLFDYNVTPDAPLITRMEVVGFEHAKASLDVAPYEHHLYYAVLAVTDFVDGGRVDMPN